MEKLVLIDGNSLINRAFYAMPVLTTKTGTPTNAVYGFMNMFFKMLSDIKPTYVAVAFDLKAPTFRHKIYSEYKGTRKPMPEELRPQIPLLKEVLRLMGVAVIEKEGSEADDIIGTIAKHTKIQTVIFTGDKDSFQLVDEETEVHFTKRGITDVDVLNNQNFTEKTGITPPQIIDLKALMGDSSDNIPGIKGVGEKTAISLIQTYNNVDNLYAHTDELKGKLKEKIVEGKESAYLSRTLATIDTDCGVDTDVSKMTIPSRFSDAVKQKFIELEFKSLFRREDLFDSSSNTAESVENAKTPILAPIKVENLEQLNSLNLEQKITLYFAQNRISLFDGTKELLINIKENLLDVGLSLSEVLNALSPILNGTTELVVFNKKELKHFIKRSIGLELTSPTDDLAIIKYLADYSGKDETVNQVIEEYGLSLDCPAQSLNKIYDLLMDKLRQENMYKLYKDVELPLSDVLFDMEESGFKIDAIALSRASEKYHEIIAGLESKIRELAKEPNLNVNSPKQLGDVIFEKLKLGKGKKTRNGYSTTAEILEQLEPLHPIISLILKYRQAQKLLSTYIDGFKPLIDKSTGLIHTTFNQTLTATGRLSSKEPNLQNIPVRDDEGKELRKFFVPRDSKHVLVGADYSQIELRLLAVFSNCKSLITAFKEGKDIHSATASKVFKVDLDKVTPQQRSSAKAVNFGIIYGMSEYGLAKQLKISNAQAREYINAYFNEYPEIKAYMDKNVSLAKEKGYSVTLLGRKRIIPELLSSNYMLRQFGERVAMNMPLQGSAADVIKLAMIGVYNRLKEENLKSKLILQVHDELIIDTLISEREQVEKLLVEEMEGAVDLTVKLTVSLGSGKTWFDAK